MDPSLPGAPPASPPAGKPSLMARLFAKGMGAGAIGVSSKRKGTALAIAGLADLAQLIFMPLFGEGFASPLEDLLDAVVAVALVVILGFSWRLAFAFATELLPGADLFPTWSAVVLSLPASDAPATTPAAPATPPAPPPASPAK